MRWQDRQRTSLARAEAWLDRQTSGLSEGLSIVADQPYGEAWAGPISGTFVAPDGAVASGGSPLTVTAPLPIPDRFEGVISGTAPAGVTRVVAYLRADADYEQSDAVLSGGAWTFEAVGRAGEWVFRGFDAQGAQVGAELLPNQPLVYQGLELRLYSVTDVAYLTEARPAPATGRFTFAASAPGVKRVELHGPGGMLGRWTGGARLIRSYDVRPGDAGFGTPFAERCYLYDQALYILALLQRGRIAEAAEAGARAATAQLGDGAFPFSTGHLSPTASETTVRVGAHAWVVYALARTLEASGDARLTAPLRAGLTYLRGMVGSYGLVSGGRSRFVGQDYTYDEAYVVPWHSTEHNIDAWYAFVAGGRALGESAWYGDARALKVAMLTRLWNPAEGRFYQGLAGNGQPDTAGALDCNTWGAVLLTAWGEHEKAASAMVRAEALYRVATVAGVGYKPYADSDGYAGALNTLWIEGSYGAVLALRRMGNPAHVILGATLGLLQDESGAYRYAMRRDEPYEITTLPSVASSAWRVMMSGQPLVWDDADPG